MSVDEASPQSDPEDVAAERGLSRRLLLGGGAAALAAVSTPLAFGGTAVGAATSNRDDRGDRRGGAGRSALGFAAVAPNVDDAVTVPDGYGAFAPAAFTITATGLTSARSSDATFELIG